MARKRSERRSLASALQAYLSAKGWNISEVKEGFQTNDTITVPTVSVYFLTGNFRSTEMAQDHKAFRRPVQIDAYMESEHRADAIVDDIMDFIEEVPVAVKDSNDNVLASMICFDNTTINGDTQEPRYNDPLLLRWRGLVKAVYDVDYNT